MTRTERVIEAQRRIAKGQSQAQVAEAMGVALSTVNGWLTDPFLLKQKARRARYSKPCADCGKPTDGSGGYASSPLRCLDCNARRGHEEREWTAASIIRWIQQYVDDHGAVPPATVQIRPGGPHTGCVHREFGTNGWRRAVTAAGFQPIIDMDHCGTGHALGADNPLMQETAKLYESGLSTAQIAEMHGVTAMAIYYRLKRMGTKMRSPEEGRQLRLRATAAPLAPLIAHGSDR